MEGIVRAATMANGAYRVTQSWLAGAGVVTVDARVAVRGNIGSPEAAIGAGLDSGDGNAFAYSGSVSGAGDVAFFMGPSSTDYQDAPLRLTGPKPNTATGKFLVKKGRVQLEKPAGVAAISGDMTVGGQGFNDCLFWKDSHQLTDTVAVTLLDAGNSGAAYLHLNGWEETAASLTMTANNRVRTDSPEGASGSLTVKALAVGGVPQPAGVYTAATAKWIEGKGKVTVRP